MGFHPTKLNFVPSDADEAPLDVSICLHAFGIVGCGSFSGVKSCEREVKKLVVGPWVGSIGPPPVCTGRLVPSAGDALLSLTGRVVPPGQSGAFVFIVRGEILGFMKDEQLRKHLPRMFSLIKNESWGSKTIRSVLVSTINDADQGSADVAFRTPLAPYEKSKSLGSGGSMVARLKLKGIDGRAPHQEWSLRLNLTQHGETYQVQT
ncbi:hypothetical protein JHK84_057340 [Glycine max]|nr:hypothetical protein JHK84_057340 [Glycine max]